MKKIKYFALLSLAFLVSTSNVFAASAYVTTLTLADNNRYKTSSRSYASGSHIIDMSIDSWYTTCSINTNKTNISLINSSYKQLASVTVATKVGTSVYKNLGSFTSGNKHYYFYSYIGNTAYCGFRSNSVKLYPKA